MPLQPQVIDIPVGGGVDERQSPKGLQPGRYRSLINARWPNVGEVETRLGSTIVANAISGLPLLAGNDNVRLMSNGEHLLLADGYQLGALPDLSGGTTLKAIGPIPEAVVTRAGIAGDIVGVTNVDVAYCSSGTYSGCLAYAYAAGAVGSAVISVRVVNATTGAPAYSTTIVSGDYGNPKVVFVNGEIVVTYVDGGANIFAYKVVAGSSTTLRTDNAQIGYPSANYDVCATSTRFYIAYQKTGGGTDVVVYGYSSAASQVTTGTSALNVSSAKTAFGICATASEKIWITYMLNASSLVKASAFDLAEPTLAEAVAAFTILSTSDSVYTTAPCRGASATKCSAIIGAVGSGIGYTAVSHFDTSVTIDGAAASRITYWSMPVSRPFAYTDASTATTKTTMYCWLVAGAADTVNVSWGSVVPGGTKSGENGALSLVLVDLNADDPTFTTGTSRPVAVAAARFSAVQRYMISSVVSPATKKYIAGGLITHDVKRTKVSAVRLQADFAHVNRWQPARLGDDLYIGGGLVAAYDGARVFEAPFVYYPERVAVADSNTSGNLVAGKAYSYVVCYAYTDGNGNVIRSAPSAARTHTVGGGKTAHAITIPYLSLTTKRTAPTNYPPVILEIYRTVADSSGPYYLISSSTQNVALTSTVTYTDTIADSSITSNAQLYTDLNGTDTSTVPNVCPPSCTALLAHNGSLWAIGDDERTVWVSKPYVDGEIVGWTDVATVPFDEGVRLTALAPMDSVVLAFSRNRIYQITGLPPTAAVGDGGSLQVYRVNSDYGCIDARSVCVTPDGVAFQSSGGYYLIDRGLNVVPFFGEAIQNTLGTYSTVTSCVVHPTGKYVIATAHSGSTTGVRLVFDYRLRQWGVDQVHGYSTANVRICSAATVGDYYYWIDKDGYLSREFLATESNSYLDHGSWITLQGETADVKLAGLQGYQRVWKVGLLGTRYTSHDLKIEIATDYSASFAQSQTFTSVSTDAWSLEQGQVHVVRQLCEAVRVRFTSVTPTGGTVGSGRGFAVTGLALEVGVMPRVHRLASAQRS